MNPTENTHEENTRRSHSCQRCRIRSRAADIETRRDDQDTQGCLQLHGLEYGKDHFRQPLFQFTEGRLLDRSLWYAFKARRSDSNAFLASVPSKSTPVYDMLYKTLLMAYYTRGFSVYQDHGDVYFKCDYPTQTRGLANAVKYLSRKASAARLVLNHIALHTSADVDRRVAMKALQLQAILVTIEHDDYHIGNVLWSNIELLKGVV